mmetsp:Transcript_2184/g.3120  ORF Transcript_2184/g.3120 Transcript_2184/m.3120 type:complete len:252 (+) Transcript_2184:604-1359(+)
MACLSPSSRSTGAWSTHSRTAKPVTRSRARKLLPANLFRAFAGPSSVPKSSTAGASTQLPTSTTTSTPRRHRSPSCRPPTSSSCTPPCALPHRASRCSPRPVSTLPCGSRKTCCSTCRRSLRRPPSPAVSSTPCSPSSTPSPTRRTAPWRASASPPASPSSSLAVSSPSSRGSGTRLVPTPRWAARPDGATGLRAWTASVSMSRRFCSSSRPPPTRTPRRRTLRPPPGPSPRTPPPARPAWLRCGSSGRVR